MKTVQELECAAAELIALSKTALSAVSESEFRRLFYALLECKDYFEALSELSTSIKEPLFLPYHTNNGYHQHNRLSYVENTAKKLGEIEILLRAEGEHRAFLKEIAEALTEQKPIPLPLFQGNGALERQIADFVLTLSRLDADYRSAERALNMEKENNTYDDFGNRYESAPYPISLAKAEEALASVADEIAAFFKRAEQQFCLPSLALAAEYAEIKSQKSGISHHAYQISMHSLTLLLVTNEAFGDITVIDIGKTLHKTSTRQLLDDEKVIDEAVYFLDNPFPQEARELLQNYRSFRSS